MNKQTPSSCSPVLLSTWSFGRTANRAGWPLLNIPDTTSSTSALDAVEAACVAVEDDPEVDSVGLGGLPDRGGSVTLDGAVMVSPARCGSVCAVKHVRHPVSLARLVMDRTDHVLLAGAGADDFGKACGLPIDTDLLTSKAEDVFNTWQEDAATLENDDRFRGWIPPRNIEEVKGIKVDPDDPEANACNRFHDTVGVLALDKQCNLAAACSTSGMAFKVPGRVGDSPIVGHGLYCEPSIGCAIATGTGELIMGVCGSFLAIERLRMGDSPAQAARVVIDRIVDMYDVQPHHQVAVLVMNASGEWSASALRPGYRTAVMTEDRDAPELIPSAYVAFPEPPAKSML